MEIPAPQAGVVVEVRVAVGDKVNEGDPILTLDADAGQAAAEAADEDRAEAAEHVEDIAAPAERGDAAAPAAAPPVAEPAAAGPVEAREVRVPDIGDFKGVEVIEVLVGVGDRVDAEQSLLTLESDKASMEIPAPFAGTVSPTPAKPK